MSSDLQTHQQQQQQQQKNLEMRKIIVDGHKAGDGYIKSYDTFFQVSRTGMRNIIKKIKEKKKVHDWLLARWGLIILTLIILGK